MVDDFGNYRLSPEERKYLKSYWNNSFTAYTRSSLKHDMELIKNNKKQNKLQKHLQDGIFIGLGLIFLFFTMTQRSLIGMVFVFLMGIFFTSTGIVDLYYSRRKK